MAPALGPIWAWTSRPVRGNPRRPTTGGSIMQRCVSAMEVIISVMKPLRANLA